MTSPVDIANIALLEIGHQETIASFEEDSPTARVVAQLYEPKLLALMRSAHWNCLRKQGSLTQLRAVTINGISTGDPPPVPWYYEYAYPSDCVKARFIVPYNNELGQTSPALTSFSTASPYLQPTASAVPFVVATDVYPTAAPNAPTKVILCNLQNAILVYTANIDDPDQWDSQFAAAATSFLGAWFVNALSRNRALANDQSSTAQAIIASARVSDGNEGPQAVDHTPDWIRARGVHALPDGIFGNSWDIVAFPGGMTF